MWNPFRRRRSTRSDSASQTETDQKEPKVTQEVFAQTSSTEFPALKKTSMIEVSTSTSLLERKPSYQPSNLSTIKEHNLKDSAVNTSNISFIVPSKDSKVFVSTSSQWEDNLASSGRQSSVDSSHLTKQSIQNEPNFKDATAQTSSTSTPPNDPKTPRKSVTEQNADWMRRKSKESLQFDGHPERNNGDLKGLSLEAPAPLYISSPRDEEIKELKVKKPVLIFPADKPGVFFMPGITNIPLMAPFPFPPFFPPPLPLPHSSLPMPPVGIKSLPLIQPLPQTKGKDVSGPREQAAVSRVESSKDTFQTLHSGRQLLSKGEGSHRKKDRGEDYDADFSNIFKEPRNKEETDSYSCKSYENPNMADDLYSGDEVPSQKRTFICRKHPSPGNNQTYICSATDNSCQCQKNMGKVKQIPPTYGTQTTLCANCQCCCSCLQDSALATSRCGFIAGNVCDGCVVEDNLGHINASMFRSVQVSLRSSNKKRHSKVKKYNFNLDTIKILGSLLSGARGASLNSREVNGCRRRTGCYCAQNRLVMDQACSTAVHQIPPTAPCPCEAASPSPCLKPKESISSKFKSSSFGRHLKQLLTKFDKDLSNLPDRRTMQDNAETDEFGKCDFKVGSPCPNAESKCVDTEDHDIKCNSVPFTCRRRNTLCTFGDDDMFTSDKCGKSYNDCRELHDRCGFLVCAKKNTCDKMSPGRPVCYENLIHCCGCKCECCRIEAKKCPKEIKTHKRVRSTCNQTNITLEKKSKNSSPEDNEDSTQLFQPTVQESSSPLEETHTSTTREEDKYSSITEECVDMGADLPKIDTNSEDRKCSSKQTTTNLNDEYSDVLPTDQQQATINSVEQEIIPETEIKSTELKFFPALEDNLFQKSFVIKNKFPCYDHSGQSARKKNSSDDYNEIKYENPCKYHRKFKSDDNKCKLHKNPVINEKYAGISHADGSFPNEQYSSSNEEEDLSKPSGDINKERNEQGSDEEIIIKSEEESNLIDKSPTYITDWKNDSQTPQRPCVDRSKDDQNQDVHTDYQPEPQPKKNTASKERGSYEYNFKPSIFCAIKRKSVNKKDIDFIEGYETKSRFVCDEDQKNNTRHPCCVYTPQPPSTDTAEDVKPANNDKLEENSPEVLEPTSDKESIQGDDSEFIVYAMSNNKFQDTADIKLFRSTYSSQGDSREQSTICNLPDLDSEMSEGLDQQDSRKEICQLLRMQSSTNNISQLQGQSDILPHGDNKQVKRNNTFTSKKDNEQIQLNDIFTSKNDNGETKQNNTVTSKTEKEHVKRNNTFTCKKDNDKVKRNNIFTSNNDCQQSKRQNTFTCSRKRKHHKIESYVQEVPVALEDNDTLEFPAGRCTENHIHCRIKGDFVKPTYDSDRQIKQDEQYTMTKGTRKSRNANQTISPSIPSKTESKIFQISNVRRCRDRQKFEYDVPKQADLPNVHTYKDRPNEEMDILKQRGLPNVCRCRDSQKFEADVPKQADSQFPNVPTYNVCPDDEVEKLNGRGLPHVRRCRDRLNVEVDNLRQQNLQNVPKSKARENEEADMLKQYNLRNIHRCRDCQDNEVGVLKLRGLPEVRRCQNEEADILRQDDYQLENVHAYKDSQDDEVDIIKRRGLPNVHRCKDCQEDEVDMLKKDDFHLPNVHRCKDCQEDEVNMLKKDDFHLPNVHRCKDCQEDEVDMLKNRGLPKVPGSRDCQKEIDNILKQDYFQLPNVYKSKARQKEEADILQNDDFQLPNVHTCKDCQDENVYIIKKHSLLKIHRCRDHQNEEEDILKQDEVQKPNAHRCRDHQNEEEDILKQDEVHKPNAHRCRDHQNEEEDILKQDEVHKPNAHRCRVCPGEEVDILKQQDLPHVHRYKDYKIDEVDILRQHELHIHKGYIYNRKQLNMERDYDYGKNSLFCTIKNKRANLKGMDDTQECEGSQHDMSDDNQQNEKHVYSSCRVCRSRSASVVKTEVTQSSDIDKESEVTAEISKKGLKSNKPSIIRKTDSSKAEDSIGIAYPTSKTKHRDTAYGKMSGFAFSHKDNSPGQSTTYNLSDIDSEMSETRVPQNLLKDISELLRGKEDPYDPSYNGSNTGNHYFSNCFPTRCYNSILQCNCGSKMQGNEIKNILDCSCTNLGHHLLVCRPCSKQFGFNHCRCRGKQHMNLNDPSNDCLHSDQCATCQCCIIEKCRSGRYCIVKSNSNTAENSQNKSSSYFDQDEASLKLSNLSLNPLPTEQVSFPHTHSTEHQNFPHTHSTEHQRFPHTHSTEHQLYFACHNTQYKKQQTFSPCGNYFGDVFNPLGPFIMPELAGHGRVHSHDDKCTIMIQQRDQENNVTISKIVTESKRIRLCLEQGCRCNSYKKANNKRECRNVQTRNLAEPGHEEFSSNILNPTNPSKEDKCNIVRVDNKQSEADLEKTSCHGSNHNERELKNSIRNFTQILSDLSKNERKTRKSEVRNSVNYESSLNKGDPRANISSLSKEELENISSLSKEELENISSLSKEELENISSLSKEELENISSLSKEELENISNLSKEELENISNLSKEELENISNLSKEELENISSLSKEELENISSLSKEELENISSLSKEELENISSLSKEELENISSLSKEELENISSLSKEELENISNESNRCHSQLSMTSSKDNLKSNKELTNSGSIVSDISKLELNTTVSNDGNISKRKQSSTTCNYSKRSEREANSCGSDSSNTNMKEKLKCLLNHSKTGSINLDDNADKQNREDLNNMVISESIPNKQEEDNAGFTQDVRSHINTSYSQFTQDVQSHRNPSYTDFPHDARSQMDPRHIHSNHSVRSHRNPSYTYIIHDARSRRDPSFTDSKHDIRSHRNPSYTDILHDARSHVDPRHIHSNHSVRSHRDPSYTDFTHDAQSHRDPSLTDSKHDLRSQRNPNPRYIDSNHNVRNLAPNHINSKPDVRSHRDPSNTDSNYDVRSHRDPSYIDSNYDLRGHRDPSYIDSNYDLRSHRDPSYIDSNYDLRSYRDPSYIDSNYDLRRHRNTNYIGFNQGVPRHDQFHADNNPQNWKCKDPSETATNNKHRKQNDISVTGHNRTRQKRNNPVKADQTFKIEKHRDVKNAVANHEEYIESSRVEPNNNERKHREPSDAELNYKDKRHKESNDAEPNYDDTKHIKSSDAEPKYKDRKHEESRDAEPTYKGRKHRELKDAKYNYKHMIHEELCNEESNYKNRRHIASNVTEPIYTDRKHREPSDVEPIYKDRKHRESSDAEPVYKDRKHREPSDAEPPYKDKKHREPSDAEPIYKDKKHREPSDAEPTYKDMKHRESSDAEPIYKDRKHREPSDAEPTYKDMKHRDPSDAERIYKDKKHREPSDAEPTYKDMKHRESSDAEPIYKDRKHREPSDAEPTYKDMKHREPSDAEPTYKDMKHREPSDAEPIYKDRKYRESSGAQPTYNDMKHRESSDAEPTYKDRKHRESSDAEPAYKDRKHRESSDAKPNYENKKYGQSGDTEPNYKDKKHRESSDTEPTYKDRKHREPSDAEPTYKDMKHREPSDAEPTYKDMKHREPSDAEPTYKDMKHREPSDAEPIYKDRKYRESSGAESTYNDMKHRESSDAEPTYKEKQHRESSDAEPNYIDRKDRKSKDAERSHKQRKRKESSDAEHSHTDSRKNKEFSNSEPKNKDSRKNKEFSNSEPKNKDSRKYKESSNAEPKNKDSRKNKMLSDVEASHKGTKHGESSDAEPSCKDRKHKESSDAKTRHKQRKQKKSRCAEPNRKTSKHNEPFDKHGKHKELSDWRHSHKSTKHEDLFYSDCIYKDEKEKVNQRHEESSSAHSIHSLQNHEAGTVSHSVSLTDSRKHRLETHSNIKCTLNQTALSVQTETNILPASHSFLHDTPSSSRDKGKQEIAKRLCIRCHCRKKRKVNKYSVISDKDASLTSESNQSVRRKNCQIHKGPCLKCACPKGNETNEQETNYLKQYPKDEGVQKNKSSPTCQSLSESQGFSRKLFTTSASRGERKHQINTAQPYKWQPKEIYPHLHSSDSSQLQISSNSLCQNNGKPCPSGNHSPEFFSNSFDSPSDFRGYPKCQTGKPLPAVSSQCQNLAYHRDSYMGVHTKQLGSQLRQSISQCADSTPQELSESSRRAGSSRTDSYICSFKLCNLIPCRTCGQIKGVLRKQNCSEISSTSQV